MHLHDVQLVVAAFLELLVAQLASHEVGALVLLVFKVIVEFLQALRALDLPVFSVRGFVSDSSFCCEAVYCAKLAGEFQTALVTTTAFVLQFEGCCFVCFFL